MGNALSHGFFPEAGGEATGILMDTGTSSTEPWRWGSWRLHPAALRMS